MQNIRATIPANALVQVRSRKRGPRRPQATARHAFTLVRFIRIPRPGEDNYPDTDEFTWGEGL